MEPYAIGEACSTLTCGHQYHQICLDYWCAARHELGSGPTCPECRARGEVASTENWEIPDDEAAASAYQEDDDIGIPTPSDATFETGFSFDEARNMSESGFAGPWWPADGAQQFDTAYHANMQMRNGKLSITIDPGADANLIGSKLARRATQAAPNAGHPPMEPKRATGN